jgi:hypothetical protein
MEEIFWEKLICVVVEPWLKFHDFWRLFDLVLDFSFIPRGCFLGTQGDHPLY